MKVIFNVTVPASIKPRINRVCPDGKTTPLLEGEENVFPCVYDCPTGFSCEFQGNRTNYSNCRRVKTKLAVSKVFKTIYSDSPDGGICCPDLDILYDIYAD